MKTLEAVMRAMMNTMAKNDDMQKVAADIHTKSECVPNVVEQVSKKVNQVDHKVQGIDTRLTDIE